MASKRAEPVREVYLEKESHKETKPEAGSDIIAQLEKFVKNLQQGSRKGRNRRSAGRSASDTVAGKGGCWGCGQPGHFQRDCPKASTRSVEMAAKPTNTAVVAVASTTRVQGNEQQLRLRGRTQLLILMPPQYCLILDLLTVQATVWWKLTGRSCPLTIDSGSSISLVRAGLLKQEVEPLQNSWLRTVIGERTPIHGWSDVQLGVGTLKLPHRTLVADIKDDRILGFDLLKKHRCVVYLKEDVLTIHNQQVILQRLKQTTPLACCRVTLGKCEYPSYVGSSHLWKSLGLTQQYGVGCYRACYCLTKQTSGWPVGGKNTSESSS